MVNYKRRKGLAVLTGPLDSSQKENSMKKLPHDLLHILRGYLDGGTNLRSTGNALFVLKSRIEVIEKLFEQNYVKTRFSSDVLDIDVRESIEALTKHWSASAENGTNEYVSGDEPSLLDRFSVKIDGVANAMMVATWLTTQPVWYKHHTSTIPGIHYFTVSSDTYELLKTYCALHDIKLV